MKVVVIGGTGLIGSKLIPRLEADGHQAIAAAPDTGVNTLTGEGLAGVLEGADAVIDVSNSPSFDAPAVTEFFTKSTQNLMSGESAAGVGHHVALSIVGTDRMQDSDYLRAKMVQERIIEQSRRPYSIVHATQFYEFVPGITDAATVGDSVHVPPVLFQPMAADDVAAAVGTVAEGAPINGIVEVGGPRAYRFDELIGEYLDASHDQRHVVADDNARYYGARLSERSLVPEGDARRGAITFENWMAHRRGQRR